MEVIKMKKMSYEQLEQLLIEKLKEDLDCITDDRLMDSEDEIGAHFYFGVGNTRFEINMKSTFNEEACAYENLTFEITENKEIWP